MVMNGTISVDMNSGDCMVIDFNCVAS